MDITLKRLFARMAMDGAYSRHVADRGDACIYASRLSYATMKAVIKGVVAKKPGHLVFDPDTYGIAACVATLAEFSGDDATIQARSSGALVVVTFTDGEAVAMRPGDLLVRMRRGRLAVQRKQDDEYAETTSASGI